MVGRIPGRLTGESLDRLGNPTFRMTLQTQEQHIRLHEDQLITDTADLKMTEDALAEDTAAFEDATQDCLAIQAKVADFEAYTKNLSEELEALAKAKAVISEKTDDSEYRDNRSVLSSRGGLARELIKSEHSIELAQLASRVDPAIHAETSNGDDPFAKVKGLISDMIARLEEKASEDATHKAFEATHIFNSVYSEIEMMRYMTMSQHKDLYLTTSMISFVTRSWPEVRSIYPFDPASNTINNGMLNPCKTSFDTCSLQPTNGAAGEYAGLLVISKYQESIGQDLGMKSAHGMNPDSAVMPHISMKIKWIDDPQGVPLEELRRRTRQETKGLIIVDLEMIAVKSCKSPDYSGWNGWQSIVIETDHGDAWVDKTDENIQSLEMYDAMRKTTESEREAKDQIKTFKTRPQMRKKVHQIKERREVLEKPQELSKENGKDDTELRDFAARFNKQDTAVQLLQDIRSLETAQFEFRAAVETKDAEFAKSGLAKYADVLKLKMGKSDVWKPDKKPFLEQNHKWVNIMAPGEPYPTNEDSMQFTW